MPTSFRVGAGPCLGIGRCSYVEAPEDRISAEVKVVNRKHELTSHPCRAPTRDSYGISRADPTASSRSGSDKPHQTKTNRAVASSTAWPTRRPPADTREGPPDAQSRTVRRAGLQTRKVARIKRIVHVRTPSPTRTGHDDGRLNREAWRPGKNGDQGRSTRPCDQDDQQHDPKVGTTLVGGSPAGFGGSGRRDISASSDPGAAAAP